MDLRIFWLIVKARWLLVMSVLLITVAAAGYITMNQPRQYIAWTSVVLDFKTENPFDRSGLPAQLSSSYMATQMDILQSPKVARAALEILAERGVDGFALHDDPERRDADAGRLLWNLQVDPSRESRVVRIGYRSTNPKTAVVVADAFAEAFINVNLDLSIEPARRNAAWFDSQLVVLRERLEQAEAKLTIYQQEKGIVALDERLDTETSRLNELAKSLVAAQAATYEVLSRQLGERHPEYLSAVERERALRRSHDRQKARILELKQQRDELGLLAREVENERESYEATLQGYHQARLASQFNSTNISVLSAAVEPRTPDSPNIVLNMASAVVLGLLSGLAFAILLELFGRRIRSASDLQDGFGVEVLARI